MKEDMTLTINGEKLTVLFTFQYLNNNYIVYQDENNELSASIYKYLNKEIELIPIESDQEWDYVDQMIEEKIYNAKSSL